MIRASARFFCRNQITNIEYNPLGGVRMVVDESSHKIKLSALLNFLLKHRTMIVAATVLMVFVALMIPGEADLAKLHDLLDRGNYQAAREGARQVLARKPESHAYRELLAMAELASGRPVEALEHTLILAGTGWNTETLMEELNKARTDIGQDAEITISVLELLTERLPEHPDLGWLKTFGLNLLIEGDAVNMAPGFLDHFHQADFETHSYLIGRIWEAVHSGGLEAAWRTAEILDTRGVEIRGYSSNLPGYSLRTSFFTVGRSQSEVDPEQWIALQENFPQDPLLALMRGVAMDSAGLAWLTEWESVNQVDGEVLDIYQAFKVSVLARAASVEPEHLASLPPLFLFQAAMGDAINKDKLEIILDYLDGQPELANYSINLEAARLALAAPAPKWTIPKHGTFGMFLEGDWLRISKWPNPSTGNIYEYYNLLTEQEFQLPGSPSWSPGGKQLAVQNLESLVIYNAQGVMVSEFPRQSNLMQAPFWRDEENLWLSIYADDLTLYMLNTNDGTVTKAEGIPEGVNANLFWYGPGGMVAWYEGNDFCIFDGEKVITIQQFHQDDNVWVGSWAPDGSGLIIARDAEFLYYEIGGRLRHLDLPESGYNTVSWLNDDEFTWEFPIGVGQRMLGIYNLKTGKTTMTGIANPVNVSGNRVLVNSGFGEIYIFELD